MVVGREAERRARLDPARFEPNPKRRVDEGTLLLGDRVVPVTEAFAAVLGKVAGEVSRQLNGGRSAMRSGCRTVAHRQARSRGKAITAGPERSRRIL